MMGSGVAESNIRLVVWRFGREKHAVDFAMVQERRDMSSFEFDFHGKK